MRITGTGLDRETLAICIGASPSFFLMRLSLIISYRHPGLLETGVNPEALATVIKELRKEAASFKSSNSPSLQR
jgi:hypothetical protein